MICRFILALGFLGIHFQASAGLAIPDVLRQSMTEGPCREFMAKELVKYGLAEERKCFKQMDKGETGTCLNHKGSPAKLEPIDDPTSDKQLKYITYKNGDRFMFVYPNGTGFGSPGGAILEPMGFTMSDSSDPKKDITAEIEESNGKCKIKSMTLSSPYRHLRSAPNTRFVVSKRNCQRISDKNFKVQPVDEKKCEQHRTGGTFCVNEQIAKQEDKLPLIVREDYLETYKSACKDYESFLADEPKQNSSGSPVGSGSN